MYIPFNLYCCFACISVTSNVQLCKICLMEILIEFNAAASKLMLLQKGYFPVKKASPFSISSLEFISVIFKLILCWQNSKQSVLLRQLS